MTNSLPNLHFIIGKPLEKPDVTMLDLSPNNIELEQVDQTNNQEFSKYIFNGSIRIGGYLEQRSMYAKSELFEGGEPRTIHLGVDIWTPAGHPIFAPVSGVISGIGDNSDFGNYGPTLVVQHQWNGQQLFALYGHLGREVLDMWKVGDEVAGGEQLATVGNEEVNGNWPPHLHFQLIRSIDAGAFDYPGVCRPSEVSTFAQHCPNPNIFLQSPLLEPVNLEP